MWHKNSLETRKAAHARYVHFTLSSRRACVYSTTTKKIAGARHACLLRLLQHATHVYRLHKLRRPPTLLLFRCYMHIARQMHIRRLYIYPSCIYTHTHTHTTSMCNNVTCIMHYIVASHAVVRGRMKTYKWHSYAMIHVCTHI